MAHFRHHAADNGSDNGVQPVISMRQDCWRIRFTYSETEYWIEVKHHLGRKIDEPNDYNVVGYDTNGEICYCVTRDEFQARVQQVVEHEDISPEDAATALEARGVTIIDSNVFWRRVEDCANRWNAMLFLFQPQVAT